MEPKEKQSRHGCDESKCVSKGRSDLHNGSFTCYGDYGTFYPMMCADGYLPMISSDEPSHHTVASADGVLDIPLQYFTCCPPYNLSSKATLDVARHCSDPIITTPNHFQGVNNSGSTNNTSTICNNLGRLKHPHQMKAGSLHSEHDSFVCCDSTIPTKSFLSDVECVPYRNEFYEASIVQNEIGKLSVILCDFPQGSFVFPRPVFSTASTGKYQCCKTGPAMPPFVQDSVFQITLYPVIVLFSGAAFVSAIVALGLAIPLFIQLKNGAFERSMSFRNSSSRTLRSSVYLSGSDRRTAIESQYSTYNLYLVYLALADFIYALFQIALYGSTINQKFYPGFYGSLVFSPILGSYAVEAEIRTPYIIANLWINAVISYQVLALLQSSRSARRINQPSLRRVNLQAGAIFFVATILGYIFSIINDADRNAMYIDNDMRKSKIFRIVFLTSFVGSFGPPIIYVIYVTILIWRRSYMPSSNGSTPRAKATRELSFYFFRIIGIFFGVWVPTLLCTGYDHSTGKHLGNLLALCLMAIQPILTTCLILTKSDARKYIYNLVTLSYLFRGCSCIDDCSCIQNNTNDENNGRPSEVIKDSTMRESTTASDTMHNPSQQRKSLRSVSFRVNQKKESDQVEKHEDNNEKNSEEAEFFDDDVNEENAYEEEEGFEDEEAHKEQDSFEQVEEHEDNILEKMGTCGEKGNEDSESKEDDAYYKDRYNDEEAHGAEKACKQEKQYEQDDENFLTKQKLTRKRLMKIDEEDVFGEEEVFDEEEVIDEEERFDEEI